MKTIRQCQFPGCETKIDQLPFSYTLCTDHFIRLYLFKQDIKHWTGEEFEETDYLFLFLHQSGCDGTTINNHMVKVIGSTSAKSALRLGWLKGKKVGRTWHVAFEELLRAVSLGRNWISVKQAGLINEITPVGFLKYARRGLLGKTMINLSGALCIRMADVDVAVSMYRKLVKAVRKFGARTADRFIREGELTTKDFGIVLGVSRTTVLNWIDRKYIVFTTRKGCKFIKLTIFWDFVERVSKNEINTLLRVKIRCNELLTELQHQAA